MAQFVIEREIPDIGTADRNALRDASSKSNGVLADMNAEGKEIAWEHSYVTDDKIFCIYSADAEDHVHEHARRSGFPATTVTAIRNTISPATAEG